MNRTPRFDANAIDLGTPRSRQSNDVAGRQPYLSVQHTNPKSFDDGTLMWDRRDREGGVYAVRQENGPRIRDINTGSATILVNPGFPSEQLTAFLSTMQELIQRIDPLLPPSSSQRPRNPFSRNPFELAGAQRSEDSQFPDASDRSSRLPPPDFGARHRNPFRLEERRDAALRSQAPPLSSSQRPSNPFRRNPFELAGALRLDDFRTSASDRSSLLPPADFGSPRRNPFRFEERWDAAPFRSQEGSGEGLPLEPSQLASGAARSRFEGRVRPLGVAELESLEASAEDFVSGVRRNDDQDVTSRFNNPFLNAMRNLRARSASLDGSGEKVGGDARTPGDSQEPDPQEQVIPPIPMLRDRPTLIISSSIVGVALVMVAWAQVSVAISSSSEWGAIGRWAYLVIGTGLESEHRFPAKKLTFDQVFHALVSIPWVLREIPLIPKVEKCTLS